MGPGSPDPARSAGLIAAFRGSRQIGLRQTGSRDTEGSASGCRSNALVGREGSESGAGGDWGVLELMRLCK